jgi:Protein of unknown function (DUF2934)
MKPKIPRASVTSVLDPEITPSAPDLRGFHGSAAPEIAAHEEILQRAYSIWECAGRPGNSELSNWLAAKAEVLAEV